MTNANAPSSDAERRAWLEQLGFAPNDDALWRSALTHGSTGQTPNYERLEFVGDRVLGLAIATWLYERSDGDEGTLAQRYNALVNGKACAAIAREIGVPDHVILGKQAREDGGSDSDNILGDVTEALLGACFMEHGYEFARDWVRTHWRSAVESDAGRAKHPKSALQEWAAGNRYRMPEYTLKDRRGPDHAARFTVEVRIHNVGSAEATANSKQEAEARAASAFMKRYG